MVEDKLSTRFKKILFDTVGILLGSFVCALGLVAFLIPNKIAAGGFSGLATILHYTFDLPVGVMMLVMEVPLFIAMIYFLGTAFGFRTLVGAFSLPVFIDLLTIYLPSVPEVEMLLAALYGGIVTGLGIGIVFRFKGTTGGTDGLAALIQRKIPLPIGQILLFIDGFIIILAGIRFGLQAALYALITVFIMSKVIDLVQEGITVAKAAFIISEHNEAIGKDILVKLDRGATALEGRGLYTGKGRDVLMVVVSQSEISRLKEVVYQADPLAFVIVSDVHEVLGEGFKKWS